MAKTEAPKRPTIPFKAVQSSQFTEYGYDAATRTLGVKFRTGATYHYKDVSPETAAAIDKADSKGSAFINLVKKGGFVFERIEDEADAS